MKALWFGLSIGAFLCTLFVVPSTAVAQPMWPCMECEAWEHGEPEAPAPWLIFIGDYCGGGGGGGEAILQPASITFELPGSEPAPFGGGDCVAVEWTVEPNHAYWAESDLCEEATSCSPTENLPAPSPRELINAVMAADTRALSEWLGNGRSRVAWSPDGESIQLSNCAEDVILHIPAPPGFVTTLGQNK